MFENLLRRLPRFCGQVSSFHFKRQTAKHLLVEVDLIFMKYLRDYLFLFSIAGLIVIVDQWTKELVRVNLSVGETWMPWDWLAPYARIVHWQNTGAAFGMGQQFGVVFAALAFVVVGAIIYYFPQVERQDWLIRVALSMQMGGALGNLIDRVNQDLVVTDFASVGNFAVWNIADAAVTVGTVVLILGVWIQEKRERQLEAEPETPPAETESSFSVEEIQGE